MSLMETIRLRCVECGDCLLWPGAMTTRGPVVTVAQKQIPLRRVVWEQKFGKLLPADRIASVDCENRNCLAEGHISARTRSQINARSNRRHGSTARNAKVANTRRKGSKLSDEGVQEIRASVLSAQALASKWSVSAAYVYMIQRGQCRRDYSSPFAGLGGRA